LHNLSLTGRQLVALIFFGVFGESSVEVTKSSSTCTEDALFRAVVEHTDGTKLQVDVFGLDLTALIDTRQVVE